MAKRSSVKASASSGLVWEEPNDPRVSDRGFYHPIAEELRKHPNKWARLPLPAGKKPNYGDAASIKQGRLTAFRPAGAFEAVNRKGVTYVRYVGLAVNGAA